MKDHNGLLYILEIARDRRIQRTNIINNLEAIVNSLQKRSGRNLALSKTGRAYRQGQLDLIKEVLG